MPFASLLAAILTLPAAFSLPSAGLDAQLVGRQATDPNKLPANWTLVGCFSDNNPATRTLREAQSPDNPAMTPLLCTEFCTGTDFSAPFNFAGTEFTSQCFCGFNIQGTASILPATSCNFPCGGDQNLTCGGASTISIYQNHNANVGPLPTNKAVVGNWSLSGCVTDVVGTNPRTLTERFPIPAVTAETCTTTCEANGFSISGLEFGDECWCGNSFLVANITAPISDCSVACSADHTELCGAANRLTIYTLNPVVPTTTATPTTTVKPTTTTPTTAAPTTATPTTATPTTTVKPTTTVAPTTTPVPTTTVKPTTTAVPTTTVVPTTTTKAA